MSTITKRDLVVQISEELPFKQKDVGEVVQAFIEEINHELAQGNDVVLRNFGTFKVVKRAAKVGRNPLDPEVAVVIPEKRAVKFQVGKALKERVEKIPVS